MDLTIQLLSKKFKRASILGWNQPRNQSGQTETVDFSLCFSSFIRFKARARYLFFVLPRSSFSTKTENDRSISSRILEPTFLQVYRWSLISKIQ